MKSKMTFTAMFLVGLIFTMIGSIFSLVGVILFSVAKFTLIHVILGAVFLGAGLALLRIDAKKKKAVRRVEEEGNYVLAKIVGVRQNRNVRVNGVNPYVIECDFTDPETGIVHRFRSHDYYEDPSPYLTSDEVRVYIDPQDLNTYSVDSDSLIRMVEH